jgi:hypothetical protein
LWDSQFGRFVNKGAITRQSGDIFFYVHTLLWAFAPWCLIFYYALAANIKSIVKKRPLAEYYSLSGGVLLLVLFSLSRFQLPFYTNTIFPLFAIITAPFCYRQLSKWGSVFRQVTFWLYAAGLVIVTMAIQYFSSPGNTGYFLADVAFLAIAAAVLFRRVAAANARAFFLVCIASLFANFYLNSVFYKLIISYRGQIKAAEYVNRASFAAYHLYTLRTENNGFQFYSNRPIAYVPLDSFKSFQPPGPAVFYVNKKSIDSLNILNADFKVIKAFQNYPQENILPAFINKETRNSTLDSVYLVTKF